VPKILDQLHEEHRNISRLLAVLERELAVFDRAERPDYDVLRAVADYFNGFPETTHHPKEDLILYLMRDKYPEQAAKMADLPIEHEKIGMLAQMFQYVIEDVLKEAELPRASFHSAIQNFVDQQRKHMKMEETFFFPIVKRTLTEEDWAALEAEPIGEQDPIFGADVAEQYAGLYKDIIAWEKENEEAAQ